MCVCVSSLMSPQPHSLASPLSSPPVKSAALCNRAVVCSAAERVLHRSLNLQGKRVKSQSLQVSNEEEIL